jgi:hypothetical protein
LRGASLLPGACLLLGAIWLAAAPAHAVPVSPHAGPPQRDATKTPMSKAPTSFLPHGGPVPQRGAPHISMPVHANTPAQHPGASPSRPGSGTKLSPKPAGLALPSHSAAHASVVAPHAGVLGGPASTAAKRAGVLQGTGLRRRPTAP